MRSRTVFCRVWRRWLFLYEFFGIKYHETCDNKEPRPNSGIGNMLFYSVWFENQRWKLLESSYETQSTHCYFYINFIPCTKQCDFFSYKVQGASCVWIELVYFLHSTNEHNNRICCVDNLSIEKNMELFVKILALFDCVVNK